MQPRSYGCAFSISAGSFFSTRICRSATFDSHESQSQRTSAYCALPGVRNGNFKPSPAGRYMPRKSDSTCFRMIGA